MITKEQFTEEAAFAKVVETTAGPALLIGGIVIQVSAPGIDAADYLSVALRRTARGEVAQTCGSLLGGMRMSPQSFGIADSSAGGHGFTKIGGV
ncbi:Hypothetical protein BROD_2249 [Brucella sp. NF 2653]|uniref:hypothetical protein n=1 Tax=unclassified Brucella TaxID=2632610 RepID=UPI0001B48CA9|nr:MULTISPECIES: hypothetical protein [unclassified Brucella]EFM61781.1 Hypothetical protein BROD_2249 [Brucella sp. NF 2653]